MQWFQIREQAAGRNRLKISWWLYKVFGKNALYLIAFFVAFFTFVFAGNVRAYSRKYFTVIEPSVQFCEMIEKSDKYNSNICIINDFLENAVDKLKQNQYDFILVSGLLHEVTEPNKLLESVKALCNKETIVHINVPNAKSFHLLWAYKSGLIERIGNLTDVAKHFQQHTTFSIDSLSKMVTDLNYSIIDKGSYFIKPFNHPKMQQLLNENIIDTNLLDGLYGLTEFFPNNGAEIFVNCKAE